jgi:hypothetical protein
MMLHQLLKTIDPPAAEVNTGQPKGKDIIPPKSVDGKTDEEKQKDNQ